MFDFSRFEEGSIDDDKDASIILHALYHRKPDPITFWNMLYSTPAIKKKINLQIATFELNRDKNMRKKVLEYHKDKIIRGITDKYVDRYIHRHIISIGLMVKAIKEYWIEKSEIVARYKFCIGRGKWISRLSYNFYIKNKIEPYSIL
jgi:hypothetical protein